MEMKTLGNHSYTPLETPSETPSETLSSVSSIYIKNGFFNIEPDSGVPDPDFIINIRCILAILLSKVGNDITRINENSIIINIEKERLSRNLSLYDVLKFMEEKFLTKNGKILEITDQYREGIYTAESNDIPRDLLPKINTLFNEILEKNDNTKLSHYFGYEPTGRYRLKMKGYERFYKTYGGKRKQRKSKKQKTKKHKSKKRQTRMLL